MHNHKFIKLTNIECCHRGLKYVEGMNTDIRPFNENPVCGSGIHFCTYGNIGDWVMPRDTSMMYVWDVTIPENERVVYMGNKLKAHRIIMSNKRYIWDNHDICIKILKRNGLALKMINNQTYDMCMAAVKNNGRALQFVKNKTRDICIEAVMRDKSALEFVDDDRGPIHKEVMRRQDLKEQPCMGQCEFMMCMLIIIFIINQMCLKN